MRITVNGTERRVPQGARLATLMPSDPSGTAVAVNDEVVPRLEVDGFTLGEGDRVEIVKAVQGG